MSIKTTKHIVILKYVRDDADSMEWPETLVKVETDRWLQGDDPNEVYVVKGHYEEDLEETPINHIYFYEATTHGESCLIEGVYQDAGGKVRMVFESKVPEVGDLWIISDQGDNFTDYKYRVVKVGTI